MSIFNKIRSNKQDQEAAKWVHHPIDWEIWKVKIESGEATFKDVVKDNTPSIIYGALIYYGSNPIKKNEYDEARIGNIREEIEAFNNPQKNPSKRKLALMTLNMRREAHKMTVSNLNILNALVFPASATILDQLEKYLAELNGASDPIPVPESVLMDALLDTDVQKKGYRTYIKSDDTDGVAFPVLYESKIKEIMAITSIYRNSARKYEMENGKEAYDPATYFSDDFNATVFRKDGIMISPDNSIEDPFAAYYATGIEDMPDYKEYTNTPEFKKEYLDMLADMIRNDSFAEGTTEADKKQTKKLYRKYAKKLGIKPEF